MNGSVGIREARYLGTGHDGEAENILRHSVLEQGKALA